MATIDLAAEWKRRPWWMQLLFAFCIFMTTVYMPFDMFVKPVAEDQEIWFGITLEGWAAKVTEPIHWAIYMAGGYGFWRMRPWMWPWASVYALKVAVAMLVWNLLQDSFAAGAVSFAVFMLPCVALYRARQRFTTH